MKKIELLAPAGNMESLYAAIEAGCDAVYIGGYGYSARSYADNFSNEEIIEAIDYAHMYGVKVYVAVNTLIYETEVESFMNYIDFLHKNNVDALIIQDLGMLDLVHKTYPNLELHASTQMHIHNLEGVKFAEKLGLSRVVLARETSIDLICKIKNNSNIELEVFGHGALCISYSGQCLMSSLIGGRSGNRGSCVGSCRLPYDLVEKNNNKIINNDKYLLSTKDLCSLENIGLLIDSGISSLKIEGRMKRPEYIFLVVSIYRKYIDLYYKNGAVKIDDSDILELKKIYNRMFTKGFLFNEKNGSIVNQFRPNHQGIPLGKVIKKDKDFIYIKLCNDVLQGDGIRILNKNEDVGCTLNYLYKDQKLVNSASSGDIIKIKINNLVSIGDIVIKTTDFNQLKSIDNKLKKLNRKVKIEGFIEAKIGNYLSLTITDSINKIKVISDNKIEIAKNSSVSRDQILKQVNKIGNTIYEFSNLDIVCDENIFIPIKILNDLKRDAISKLTNLRKYKIDYQKCIYSIDVPEFNLEPHLNYYINSYTQYQKIKNKKLFNIYVQDDTLFNKIKFDNRVIRKIPRVIEYHKNYNEPLLVGEIGSLNFYKDNKMITDFSFNVVNSYTVAFLHSIGVDRVTLSYELKDDQIENLISAYKNRYKKNPNLEHIIYGKEEMMISKFNLLKMYQKTGNNYYLKDRYNKLYKIIEDNNLMYIYNYDIRNNLNKMNYYYSIGINYLRLNILDDSDLELECKKI